MRNIVICGKNIKSSFLSRNFVDAIEIEGIPVYCGLIKTQDIEFDNNKPENEFQVLIKKIAFSCNYRDKNFILKMAQAVNTKPEVQSRFIPVGSEFVGEVVDIGYGVTNFKIGDKVIGNNKYPNSGAEGVLGGIPTNRASQEYQIFHEVKLIKIPPEMPNEVAAAFSIGGQTAYSMLRKLGITKDSNVLVTAARSNTSLFVINALQKYQANVYVMTTSTDFDYNLFQMGVKKIIRINRNCENFIDEDTAEKITREVNKFNFIIDPFFDLHLEKLVSILAIGGKYITCGLYNQYLDLLNQENHKFELDGSHILTSAIIGNFQIIGNCIGETEDLEAAIQDYQSGALKVVIDSVFSGKQIGDFFDRTYNSKERFGKVIYQYN
ncbi:MAG: zinc-binding alcohol dehydrogenase family protein [Xenococcaceae cyanobacterium MO_188.B19]|nr:zinc-binding alcohol dehydrogenase family protein [Xenococcaceae cyanobacterium MO_188.B19]